MSYCLEQRYNIGFECTNNQVVILCTVVFMLRRKRMKGKSTGRAVRLSILLLTQLVICSVAPVVSGMLDSYLKVAVVKGIYALSFAVPCIMWKRMFKPIGASYYTHGWCEFKKPAFFVAFAAIVAFLQVNIVMLELFGVRSLSSDGGFFEGILGFLFSLVMYCILPALSEETFSRGVVMRVGGMGVRAAVLSGVLFGLCHFNPYQLLYSIGTGIVLSFLLIYTEDIKLTVLLHFTVNTVVLVLSYLARLTPVGVYVAIECIVWLAVLSLGVYYSRVILRDHHRSLNEKTKELKKNKSDITLAEVFSPAMIIAFAAIVVATVLRMI